MVIWITGLSGAGKTSLARALARRFKPQIPEMVIIDGDDVRRLFGPSLGYREQDRYTQIRRIQAIARMLDGQGMVVVVAALYAHPDLLAWNRENFSSYFEVYLDAPLELVGERDSKGLYARAARGETANVVGFDIPWRAPENPDLRVGVGRGWEPDEIVVEIAKRVPKLSALLDAGASEATG